MKPHRHPVANPILRSAASLAIVSAVTAGALSLGSQAAAPTQPAVTADVSTTAAQNVYVSISEKMMPSVVNVFTTQKVRSMPNRMWPGLPGWDSWMEPQAQQHPDRAMPMSLGTGFVVEVESKGGLILTNHHVINGADEVKVKFTEDDDENEVTAQVVGQDPELDVALLRVKTDRKLVPAPLGDSQKLKVGEWIAALGNPFGHGHSITHGIVSAKERALTGGFGKYLQVDAPINPGNSGGPLVNLQGEVVGINNAIDARGAGIGFAIPVNSVKAVLARLKSGHDVERGYLGVNIMPLRPDLAKALRAEAAPGTPVVAEVMPGTPAAKAGIEPYDVITEVGGRKIKSTSELMQAIMEVPVGNRVKAEIWRGGKRMTVEVPVAKRPGPHRA